MHNNIVNFLIQFISRWGRTKVVVLYLSLVFSFITFTVVSITIEPQRIKIVCGSMSFLNILALIIITYPVSLYLRQTRQLRINKDLLYCLRHNHGSCQVQKRLCCSRLKVGSFCLRWQCVYKSTFCRPFLHIRS